MPESPYVTYGQSCGCCGGDASRAVTGCRFTLSPMTDRYVEHILSAISQVDIRHVWSKTDKLSTVYRGQQLHVEDAVMACFLRAYDPAVHMTMELTFSRGCPGDTDADCFLAGDCPPANAPFLRDIHFPVECKIALYPMGVPDYMRHIAHVVNHAIDLGLYASSSHYCTMLRGDVQALFAYFHWVNSYCAQQLSHYVFEVTLSVNSPTEEA